MKIAEVWYLEIETEHLDGKDPRYEFDFNECITLLELSQGRWRSDPDKFPRLKTGNPVVDDSGYVRVYVRVTHDEIQNLGQANEWKAGWYFSPLTVIGAERKLKSKK